MNLLDTAYHTVHDYPGGPECLAPRLSRKKGATQLCHEVRPPVGNQAKLGLVDMVEIMELSGDHRVLHAVAQRLGYVALPLPQADDDDGRGLARLAELAREFADVMATASSAMADGQVTLNELRQVQGQWGELVQAGAALMQFLAESQAAMAPMAERAAK